jgi:phosphoribosylformimino-5-aminoimidazole carboxamide ribotide isomerase
VLGRLVAAAPENALQVGGGIRTRQTADDVLAMGVARVAVGSKAVTSPGEVQCWLREFGPERVALAFDVRLDGDGTPRLATHGWETQTGTSLWDAVEGFRAAGLRHVLCTDVARDGALTGPNVPLYAEAVRRFPAIDWQASGGVSSVADLHALADTGVASVISGKALLEGRLNIEELEPFLRNA